MARIPQTSLMAQLSLVEQHTAVELFRGTMVRHSVVAYRNDNPDSAQQVSFDGDAWLGYVPIRMPDTICIEERLPSGAAAVLINRGHTYKDLYLAIDNTEKGIFDHIDSNKNISDIMDSIFPSHEESKFDRSRELFERLLLYDQVVLDTSRKSAQHVRHKSF
jgi:hypothetical protein